MKAHPERQARGAADGQEDARAEHSQNTAPHRALQARKRPPSVAALSTPRHAPSLTRLYVGEGWREALHDARHELRVYGEVTPSLALPEGTDPAGFQWPVSGRHVAIHGVLPAARLRRLLAALLRDGALSVGALDDCGALHTAASAPQEVAA